jgi:hypothetical protein
VSVAPALATAEPGFIALEGGDSRVEVVPTQGGRIRSLDLFDHEWLLPTTAATLPRLNQPPMAAAGWDECAPCAGGGVLPEWVKGVGGRELPVGGEARAQTPETSLSTDAGGPQLHCVWRGERMPWQLSRTVLVRPDGAVEARYEAQATGKERIPFLWSSWLTFPLTKLTRLRLPDGGRFRVASLDGATMTGEVMEGDGKWPRLVLDGKSRDLSTPWSVPRKAQLAAWLDLGAGRSMIQLWEADKRLTISFDGAGVPHCGLFIDRSGMQHARRQRLQRIGVPTLCLAPSLGAPGTFKDALGDWQTVTWLVPGEPRRWSMTIRGGTA